MVAGMGENESRRPSDQSPDRPAGKSPDRPAGNGESSSGRDETEEERLDRNLDELLQGLRVALPGIQVLFAFLLVVPFQQGWVKVSESTVESSAMPSSSTPAGRHQRCSACSLTPSSSSTRRQSLRAMT